jgi:hypothetical protein
VTFLFTEMCPVDEFAVLSVVAKAAIDWIRWTIGWRSLVPRLLIVHHTPSPYTQEIFEAVLSGATDPEIEGVEVIRRPALTVSATDMLEADSYLLGSPANVGYMSGALKHYFANYPLIKTRAS